MNMYLWFEKITLKLAKSIQLSYLLKPYFKQQQCSSI